MHTDASHRFERGADYGITPLACDRVAELILESAGGELHGERIDAVARELRAPRPFRCATRRSSAISASTSPKTRSSAFCGRLGLRTVDARRDARVGSISRVQVPTWRLDVEREIDLLEELARIYGYNKFPNTLPAFCGRGGRSCPTSRRMPRSARRCWRSVTTRQSRSRSSRSRSENFRKIHSGKDAGAPVMAPAPEPLASRQSAERRVGLSCARRCCPASQHGGL